MGLIGTRSLTQEIPGINQLEAESEEFIRDGLIAYDALMTIRAERADTPQAVRDTFEAHSDNLGYALLLKRYVDDPREATEEQIKMAAEDTIPGVAPLFWAFRIMVALGFSFIAVMVFFFIRASFYNMRFPRWSLYTAVAIIPAPWISAELGWFVAEFGRQPWTVDGVLPTALSVSHLSVADLLITLAGFLIFYTILCVIEMGLMVKYIRKGPFQDVEATEEWQSRHEARLRSMPGEPTASATPAE